MSKDIKGKDAAGNSPFREQDITVKRSWYKSAALPWLIIAGATLVLLGHMWGTYDHATRTAEVTAQAMQIADLKKESK